MAVAASTEVRSAVRQILEGAFSRNELDVRDDKLHPAIETPRAVAGIYPDYEEEDPVAVITQLTFVRVQVFLPWDRQITPEQTVDPAAIEGYAQRFREAFYTATHPLAGSAGLWDFRITEIRYQDDPTGNRTRFEAQVQAVGQNFAETGL